MTDRIESMQLDVDELRALRQRVKELENAPYLSQAHALCNDLGIAPGHIEDRLFEAIGKVAELSALKQQGEPVAWMTEDGMRVATTVTKNTAMASPSRSAFCIPLYTATATRFSAGDMADAAAKAFQEGAESNRAATDELLAALKSMFNEYGEFDYTISMLNNARAAIAKHEPKP